MTDGRGCGVAECSPKTSLKVRREMAGRVRYGGKKVAAAGVGGRWWSGVTSHFALVTMMMSCRVVNILLPRMFSTDYYDIPHPVAQSATVFPKWKCHTNTIHRSPSSRLSPPYPQSRRCCLYLFFIMSMLMSTQPTTIDGNIDICKSKRNAL